MNLSRHLMPVISRRFSTLKCYRHISVSTETFWGLIPSPNSGFIKYIFICFAGFCIYILFFCFHILTASLGDYRTRSLREAFLLKFSDVWIGDYKGDALKVHCSFELHVSLCLCLTSYLKISDTLSRVKARKQSLAVKGKSILKRETPKVPLKRKHLFTLCLSNFFFLLTFLLLFTLQMA